MTELSREAPRGLAVYGRAFVEWLVWLAIAGVAYAQTGRFDEEIQQYAFGATGWPRAVCIGLALGATGQFLSTVLQIRREGVRARLAARGEVLAGGGVWDVLQRAGIFVLPLVYLWLVPDVGFYVATPAFVVLLLVLLDVRKPLTILAVTGVVYGLILLIFTRFFYVALPVGRIESFYDVNNAIIAFVRIGT